ncbi:hypothetical protein [Acinetobacter modestus]|uniref:hypothetical protein n=1 Tax=Acinetobacter modestus TaxID=1776740 RepID=UPI00301B5213
MNFIRKIPACSVGMRNSEAYKAIEAARANGTLIKGAAYVDKITEKLMLVRIDPATKK